MIWNFVIAAAIVGIAWLAGGWLAGATRMALARTGMVPEVRRLVANTIQPLALAVGVLTGLSWLGVEATSLVAVLGAATLSIGVALKSSLSNVASGAILLTLRPYREGESVQVCGQTGTLEALELYTTTVRTADGTLVTLPNDLVLRSPMLNFSRTGARRTDLDFLVAPDGSKLEAAIDALSAAIFANQRVQAEPPPRVVVLRQDPVGVVLQVRAWVPATELGDARVELLTDGLQALAKAKVPLASAAPRG